MFFTAEPMDEYSSVPASIAERYKVGRTLGDGNFAVVRECVERSTGREYALKIISKDKCRGKVSLLCTCWIQLLHHQISNVHKVEVQLLPSHFFFLTQWWAGVAITLEAKIFGSGWFCLFVCFLFKSQHQMILVYRVLFWKLFSIIFSKITKQISHIVYKVFWLQCTDCFLCHPGAHDTEWSINPSACETSQHSSFDWGNGHPKRALSCNGVS